MSFVTFLETYGVTILSLLLTIASLIVAWVKAKRTGNTKGMLSIMEQIPILVQTAESLFGSGNGSAKLDYVLTHIRLYALQLGVPINVEEITAQINSVVETTKKVNVNSTTPSVEITSTTKNGASIETTTSNNQTNINI